MKKQTFLKTLCRCKTAKIISIAAFLLAWEQKTFGQPVSYSSLYSSSSFSNPTNVSLAVGAIDGQAGVSQSGAATYAIPIKCPPGTNNLMPNLSLTYSSLGGNGDLGMGWSISGLSSITRKTKDFYFNGVVAPIQYNNTDAYALDGSQLISSGGSSYVLENEDFSSITAYSVGSTGPDHFIVVKKNGTTMEYGNTSDSRLVPGGGSVTLSWRLDKITDINGNYITFTYGSTGWESHITEIDYTGNASAGLAPYNKITFSYQTNRLDGNRSYDANTYVDLSALLGQITITGSGSAAYKSYVLNYGNDNIESYLKTISEKDGSGNAINSTIFRYGDVPASFPAMGSITSGGVPGFWNTSADLFTCDFNGDGIKDIVVANKSTVSGIPYNTSLDIYTRTYTSSSYVYRSHIPLPSTFEKYQGVTLPSNYSFQTADFNGDGFEDILVSNASYSSGEPELTVNSFDIAQGNPWAGYYGPTSYWQTYATPTVSGYYYPFNIASPYASALTYPGDYNGDGICDFITVLSDATGYKAFMYQMNSSGGYTNHEISGLYYGAYSPYAAGSLVVSGTRLYVIDFDGDGKNELMVVTPNPSSTTYIYSFTDDGAGNYTAHVVYSGGYPTQGHDIYLGDFNGDGKTDMLTRIGSTYSSSNWQIANSTGTNWAVQPFSFTTAPQQNEFVTIGDFNGDGKSDVVLKRNSNNSSSHNYFDVYYSLGCTPGLPPSFHLESSPDYEMACTSNLVTSDIDGDGRADIINVPKNACLGGPDESVISFKNKGQEQILQGVIDGMGNSTAFQYQNLTSNLDYTKGSGSTYPLNDFQYPMYTVNAITVPNGIGGTTETDFSYTGEVLHKTGKGLLGFAKVVSKNLVTNISTEADYGINTTYYFPYQTNTSSSQSGTNLSSTAYTYNVSTGSPGSAYVKTLASSTENNLLSGATKTTTTTYDAYANATSTTVNNNGQETVVTNNTYVAASTPVPAVPSTSTKIDTRTGTPAITVETAYTYDGHGNLLVEKDNALSSLYVKNTYSRDVYGNVSMVQKAGGGVPPYTYTYTYDATGRFPITKTYPLGQSESAVYDPLWGKPTSVKDIEGNTTTYTHDTWGNLTAINMPEGYTINISEGWNGTLSPTQMWYSLVSHPGKPNEKIWHDALGREVLKQDETWSGTWTSVNTNYDAMGNVASTTKPYISGSETPFTTTNTYNSLNQIINSSTPFGNTTCSYTYSGGNTKVSTTDAGGHTTSKTMDATKKVISAVDAGGTLTYSYDGWGNLLKVINGGAAMTTNAYDAAGRMATSLDVDGGLTTSVYDAYGRLQSQTDARGDVVNFAYDGLSRVTSKTGTEGTTTYAYLSASTGNNTPYLVTAPSGVTDQYSYDAFGRQTQHIKTIAGTAFTTTQGYDAYDNITSTTYPSGIIVNNSYDANSLLASVSLNYGYASQNIFYGLGMNGSGEYTQYMLGNSLTSTNGYNYGICTSRYTPGVQNLNLGYDFANNLLTSRFDAIANNQENFGYDALNRLTSSQVYRNMLVGGYWMSVAEPIVNLTYSSSGNITSKTDVGSMAYGQYGASIHAVTDVADVSGDISHLRQRLTYTPFNKVSDITENSNEEKITYDADHNRVMSVVMHAGVTVSTRYYLDNCEYNVPSGGSPYYVNYIYGGDGLAAISSGTSPITVTFGGYSFSQQFPICYYVYKDQQGSILALTDKTGAVVARQNFDAWGRNRNTVSWNYMTYPYSSPGTPSWLYRGYTGHEEMPQFDLINMNGRVYDPILSRMLRPDSYVQSPFSTQGYNRYSYCKNNPATLTDPTGDYYLWDDLIVGGVGFIVGYAGEALATGNWASGKDLESGAIGAAVAEACYYGVGLLGGAPATAALATSAATQFAAGYGMAAGMALFSDQKQIAAANNSSTNIGGIQLNNGLLLIGGLELISGIGQGLSQGAINGYTSYNWAKTPLSFISKGLTVDMGSIVSSGFTSFATTILEDSYNNGKWNGLTLCDVGQAGEGAFGSMATDLIGQLAQFKLGNDWNSMKGNKNYAAALQVRCPSVGLVDDGSGFISNLLEGGMDAFHAGGWIGGAAGKVADGINTYLYNNITSHKWYDFSPLSPF